MNQEFNLSKELIEVSKMNLSKKATRVFMWLSGQIIMSGENKVLTHQTAIAEDLELPTSAVSDAIRELMTWDIVMRFKYNNETPCFRINRIDKWIKPNKKG